MRKKKAVQKTAANTKRVRIGDPLTLGSLVSLGYINDSLPDGTDFDPQGGWSNSYRIIISRGYTTLKESQVGFLRVKRHNNLDSKTFTLVLDRFLRNETDRLHHLQMQIICKNDSLSSPIECYLISEFLDPNGEKINPISQDEQFKLANNKLELKLGNKVYKKEAPGSLAIEWGLYDAVQRLSFDENLKLKFSILEGVDIIKSDQHLSYRGSDSISSSGNVSVHCFQQLGRAILPTDYWLDENHRLLAVINSGRAYVLDELMKEPMPELLKLVFDKGDFS